MTKFPEGRQASAIIPLLWRAQEQEGWLSRPAIEYVCDMLGLAHIRGLEVATFYFMYQLQPVGSVAHVQVCGTTSCMICGAEDLIGLCREKIAAKPHQLSADGKFSWEEVECLGACANAPMAQIGKDYYEDLTTERLGEILDEMAAGGVPIPGPQNGRYASEPKSGLTSLEGYEESGHTKYNASAQLAADLGDTIKRIDGTEAPLVTPWLGVTKKEAPSAETARAEVKPEAKDDLAEASASYGANPVKVEDGGTEVVTPEAKPTEATTGSASSEGQETAATGDEPTVETKKPKTLAEAREGKPDDLKMIKGVGPKLEKLLHSMGFYHFDQVAAWTSEELAWVDDNLEGFKGRATRDTWVAQAKLLASGQETEFSKRAKY